MLTHVRVVFALFLIAAMASIAQSDPPKTIRARDLGVPFDGSPGQFNAITDVPASRSARLR